MSKRRNDIIDVILEHFSDIMFYGFMTYLIIGVPSCVTDHFEIKVKESTQIEQNVNQSGVKIESL